MKSRAAFLGGLVVFLVCASLAVLNYLEAVHLAAMPGHVTDQEWARDILLRRQFMIELALCVLSSIWCGTILAVARVGTLLRVFRTGYKWGRRDASRTLMECGLYAIGENAADYEEFLDELEEEGGGGGPHAA